MRLLAICMALCLVGCNKEPIPESARFTVDLEQDPDFHKMTVDKERREAQREADRKRRCYLEQQIDADTQALNRDNGRPYAPTAPPSGECM